MNDLYYQDDREPTPSELEKISKLTDEQISKVDKAVLTAVDDRFKKVAFIVAMVKTSQPDELFRLPDTFYSRRVAHLVSEGHLESQGDLKKMRFSEVRLKS